MTQTPLLQLCGLRKVFGPKTVLDGVDIDVEAGKSLVIIGGSGTGKSVLLKCALGLLHPEEGRVLFEGVDMARARDRKREAMLSRTGMLFQGAALFDSLTIWENVAFRLIYRDQLSRTDAREKAIAALAKVRLGASVADQRPAELSGGMQKRVGLARAIISEPDLVFFDEPTTGLDPITADAINDLILEQVKSIGAASVSITHDMVSARKIADEIAMLHEGRIIWRGSPDDIDDSGNAFVDQFVHGRAEGPIQPAI